MRLPWPFGRAQRSPSEGTAASSGAPGGGSARPDGAGGPERASGDAWRRLPPLAETVGPPPLVAPNRPFAAALAGTEPPAPILAPLAHGKSLEAPRGLVAGVTRPVAASRGSELPKPVQRSPLHSKRGPGADVEAWGDDDPAPAATAPTPAAAPPVTASAAAPIAAAPIRRLEVSAAVTRTAARDLTRAQEPAALAKPLGLVGPARAAIAGVQRSPEPIPAPEPVRPAPIPAPMAAPAPAPRPDPDRDRPRLSIGQSRRLGLGSPIASGPITASSPPFAGSTASPAASAAMPARPGPDAAPEGIQRAPETAAPELPLAVRPAPSAPDMVAPAAIPSIAPAVSLPSLQPSVRAHRVGAPTPMGGPSTPIVSAQPLRARVQRAPLTLPTRPAEAPGPGTTVVAPGSAAGPGAPVKVHRDGSAAQLSKSLDARSFTHGGDIYLPASHGPLGSGKGRSLLAHELTHVTQQRRLGSSLPEEHTPHGKALEAEAVAAERGADMPLAVPPAPAQGKASTAHAGGAADLSTPAPIHASSSGATGSTTGPAQRAPTNGGGGEAGGGRKTHSEQELEDLAGQLYARIGRQLRRELLVDRERAGFSMDLG